LSNAERWHWVATLNNAKFETKLDINEKIKPILDRQRIGSRIQVKGIYTYLAVRELCRGRCALLADLSGVLAPIGVCY
jgi:hypothetical protein